MKNLIICTLVLFCAETTWSQQMWNKKTNVNYHKPSKDSSAILVLNNGLSPRAVMADNKDIICVGTNMIEQFPLIVEKIDSSGNLLWNNAQLSIPPNELDENGNAFTLPSSDGGAYFIFEYWEYRGRQEFTVFFAKYPHIQYVDAAGSVKWGPVGKRLTNMVVNFQGGASIQHVSYAHDGDIMVYWTWFNVHNTAGVENEFGTFVQKVDPTDGELKFGESGRKLFNFRASPIKQSPTGNIFMFQDRYISQNGGDSVACFNAWAEKQWQLPLLTGIENDVLAGTNDLGELLLIYGTNEDIRASLYDINGFPIWTDKILSTSVKRVIPNIITTWDKDSWIFKMGQIGSSVFCIDRKGTMCWGESGIMVSDRILTAMPLDDKSVLVAYQKQHEANNYFIRDLYLQKLDNDGNLIWQGDGIKVIENVSTNCMILPDQNGGACLIFDALQLDEPQYQSRGTYFQKVDKDGHLGLITSIKDNETINNISSTTSVNCYPNPSNGMITFRLKTESDNAANELIVYDILGREVRRFNISSLSYGETFLQWDGKNRNGIKAAPGIYFYYMKTKNNINLSGKFLRIR